MSDAPLHESRGWTSEFEVPESCILCVCYGVFDTSLGNTIQFVSPPSVRLSQLLELRSPQDFCFPDGAHDSAQDIVCGTVPRKQSHTDSSEKVLFVFSCYHRQRSAECSRGAAQRSVLIVATAPIFCALRSVALQIVFPFFERVPMAATDAHRYLVDTLFSGLSETFRTLTARSCAAQSAFGKQSSSRVFHLPAASTDAKGTVMPRGDATMSQQRVLKLELFVALEDQTKHSTQPIDSPENPLPPVVYEVEHTVPLHLALPEASLAQQMSFGASLKTLLNWFGPNICLIHWSMLTRVPVLFVGESANDVGDAVRACGHLLAPMEIDASRFAPYATLEQLDEFTTNVSSSMFIAIGATNAFVVHREVVGIVRCDTRSGKVSAGASSSNMPRAHRKAFDDLLVAARDPSIKECYFRARMVKFNLEVLRQVASKSGPYFSVLCSVPNIIDVPMDRAVQEESMARVDTSDEFVVVGDDANAATQPADSNPSTEQVLVAGAESSTYHGRNDDADEDGSLEPKLAELLRSVNSAVAMYEAHSRKNSTILKEADTWYKSMFKYLHRIVATSDESQQSLFAELKTFSINGEAQADDSLLFCASDVAAACSEQQRTDRVNRLRIVTDYKERVYYMLDGLCKGNAKALLRKENRYFSDFFNFPQCREYNTSNQVLLHSTACTLIVYMGRLKSTTSGTLYVSKNFLAFEAGTLALRKRHQIFPFDVVKNVVRDAGTVFASFAVKLMLEVPNMVSSSSVGGDDELDGSMSILLSISNISDPNGLFEILHTLFEKQQRTRRLMANIPPRHSIHTHRLLDFACPVVVPAGFYANPEAIFVDECWENQRNYPIVGWSAKLLLSDPPRHSDFSGVRPIEMDETVPPSGFEWVGEWVPACLLIDDVTSDRLMVHMSEGESQAAAELGVTSVGLVGVKKQDIGFIYNTSWTGVDTFRSKPWTGCTIRRRLWIRKRRLIPVLPSSDVELDKARGEGLPHPPPPGEVAASDSTDDEDLVDADSGTRGIGGTLIEENNDA